MRWRPGSPSYPGAAMKANLDKMFGFACGGYLMAKATSSPNVEDNDDKCHARS
jgi:hypothetical protein